jgi:hypothetical protein
MNIDKLLRIYYVRIVCCYEAVYMGISICDRYEPGVVAGLEDEENRQDIKERSGYD